MAVDIYNNCLGVSAISKKRNYITFFGISKNACIQFIGEQLIFCVFELLDKNRNIGAKLVSSVAEWIKQYRELFKKAGFKETASLIRNGIPYITFNKSVDKSHFIF